MVVKLVLKALQDHWRQALAMLQEQTNQQPFEPPQDHAALHDLRGVAGHFRPLWTRSERLTQTQ